MGGASTVWPAPSASAPVGSRGSALMLAAAHASHAACQRQGYKPAAGLSDCMLCTAAVRGAGAGRLPVSAGQRLGGGRHHQGGESSCMRCKTAGSLCFTLYSQRLGGGRLRQGGRSPTACTCWMNKKPHIGFGRHAACQHRTSPLSPPACSGRTLLASVAAQTHCLLRVPAVHRFISAVRVLSASSESDGGGVCHRATRRAS